MYRVMMVDDEIWSLIGFQRIIEEDNERFTLIGEMTDPVEALEKICKEEPDIVFVDIRMPEMSGIELMQEAKKRGVKSAFVVISGFAEFSYVQEALKAGAIDYQLKPFDKSAAKETLDNLYERLGGEKASEDLKLYAKLRDDEFSAGEVLRERFPGPLFPKLQIMQILYKGSYEPLKRDRDPYFSGDSWRTKLKIGPDRGLYIVNSVEEQTPYMLRWYRDNKDRVRKVSMSSPVSPDVSGQYILREADTNLLDAFVYPEETCFTFRRPNIGAVESLTRTIKQLKGQGKEDEIYQMVADLQSYFEKYQLGVREALCLWNILVTYSMEWNDNPAAWLEYLDVFSLTSRFGDLQEMGAYLNGTCGALVGEVSGTVVMKFQEMLSYIDEHYAEPLKLKDLCSQYYINMSYCCELFKKYRNTTFSQYLTDIRIRRAEELLADHRLSISTVCEMVGYRDYFYFNKVFKNKTGYTPAKYRDIHRENSPEE